MSERRFNETEVRAIFERAASDDRVHQVSQTEAGMTLAELQQIGRDVGIAPQLIAEAAARLPAPRQSATRGVLGLPLRVERVVDLDRRPSDAEWERLVVALREVFDARGVVKSDGSLRQWTNGNLHVFLEPTATGQRLRLRTFKGNALPLMATGLGAAGAAGAALAAELLNGAVGLGGLTGLAFAASAGMLLLVSTAVRLPRWARRRREQMNEVAARIAEASSDRGASGYVPEAIAAGAPTSNTPESNGR